MKTIAVSLIVAGLAFTTGACATSQEWAEWRSHTSHFASGDHGFFSMRNREGAATRVMRQDITAAREQGWWGKAISVDQKDIVEN
jgi:hypothetical protein